MSMAISNSKIIVNKPIAKTNNNTLKKTGNSDCFQSNLPDLKTYVQIERLDDSVIEACNKTKKLPENMKLVILPEIFKEGVYPHMGKDDPTAIYTPAQYKIYKDGESIPQNATILDKIPSNLKLVNDENSTYLVKTNKDVEDVQKINNKNKLIKGISITGIILLLCTAFKHIRK